MPIPVPETAACRAAREWVLANTPAFIANHSLRSYRLARALAPRLDVAESDFDAEVLYLACVLHDVGLTDHANGSRRFEVDGADFARDFVTDAGIEAARADLVWQAIALHTTGSIASRMAPEIALTNAGIGADVLGHRHQLLDEATIDEVHADLPRLDLADELVGAILHQISSTPSKAPPFTFPGDLALQHGAVTQPTFDDLLRANPWRDRV